MKRINMFLSAEAVEAGASLAAATVEPTSDKLTALKADRETKFMAAIAFPYGSKEQNDGLTAVFKIDGEIRAEIAAINKVAQDAKIAELRNERVKQLADRDDLLRALDAVRANKKATPEDLAAAQLAFDTANEPVVNALLSKFATVKPATTAPDGTAKPAGTKGATSQEIEALITEAVAGGMTSTEAVKSVIAKGYSRGTTGAVRTQMVKDGKLAN